MKNTDSKRILYNRILNCETVYDLNEIPVPEDDFDLWCFYKFKEIQLKTSFKNNEMYSIEKLRDRCSDYGGDLAWAISQYYMYEEKLNRLKNARVHWYNRKHLYAIKKLKEGGVSSPSNKSIEAYIENKFTKQWNYWNRRLDLLERKVKVLEELKNLWIKMDKIYTSLIYDFTNELKNSKEYEVMNKVLNKD